MHDAHAVLDPIPADLPVLDLRRATFEHFERPGPRPRGVGVLGTRGTSLSIRRGAVRAFSTMAVHLPRPDDEELLMSLFFRVYRELKTASMGESTVEAIVRLCGGLHEAGATYVIAANS